MKNKTIFVQIAAYRDPELIPTLKDMLANAKYPKRLKVCIAWQHSKEDKWDELNEFENNSNSLCKKDLSHKNSIGIYNKFYKQFYKNYVLPKKQYNFLFNNKITKFFYTDDEIKKIIDFPTIFS